MLDLRPSPGREAIELSVVIPTRNEAGNIPELLQRLRASLAGIEFEVIFVDDSDDATPDLVADAARQDPRLRLLHRPPGARAGGLSTAAVLGLHEARGRTACLMDADFQHPPETIPRLLDAERAGADVVVASRYVEGGSLAGLNGGFRRFVSRTSNWVARTVFVEARASTDPGTGFFLCRTTLLRGLEFRPVGFKTLLELLVCSSGIRVVDVPLAFEARRAGASKATAAQGWLVLRHIWSLVRDVPGSARRWKFAAVGLGGLLVFLAILDVTGVVWRWNPLAAWAVAFSISLAWNFALNLRITFADLRRARYPLLRRYTSSLLTGSAAQLAVFVGLLYTPLPLLLDGLLAALVGMGINASLHLQIIHRYHRPLNEPVGVDAFLARLTRVSRAETAAVVDTAGTVVSVRPVGEYSVSPVVKDLCARAGASGVPVLWTEPPSGRPQARTNVEMTSLIVLPLDPQQPRPRCVVLHRNQSSPFTPGDLEAAMRQLHQLWPSMSAAELGVPDPRPEVPTEPLPSG
ncbi:MAG TPA: glycosyltransferase family 2 protein [Candidatus Dormibacteraeota bacterium]|nr:glycosyltransferase family 2 protein [Candidatus Dormibacteraeota bacterium]